MLIPILCLQKAPDFGFSTWSVVSSVFKITMHGRLALMLIQEVLDG